jgi:hypothetical protein
MYKISDYFRKLIDEAGGAQKFAEKYDFNLQAIEDYYSEVRQIQETTLIGIAVKMELWRNLGEKV